MEQGLKKWLTTHGPEDDSRQGPYVLRVSQRLEFLCGDHPLIQYKVCVFECVCVCVCVWRGVFKVHLTLMSERHEDQDHRLVLIVKQVAGITSSVVVSSLLSEKGLCFSLMSSNRNAVEYSYVLSFIFFRVYL